jgi:uncharacterized membrane protein YphA (DoxX/SURF4 family)
MFMNKTAEYLALFLRIALGLVTTTHAYSLFTNDSWSIRPLLESPDILPNFFGYLLQPNIIQVIDTVYPVVLMAAGISLILGFMMKLGGSLGIIMLLLRVIPNIKNIQDPIVYNDIIVIITIALLISIHADSLWGINANIGVRR